MTEKTVVPEYNADLEITKVKLNNAYTEDYTPYDARGNRKAATGQCVYNDLNQLTETPTQQYTYDADGNLTEIGTKPCTDDYEKKVMTYDIDNRMVGFQHYPASSTTPDITASYIYDLYGRRLKKTVTQSGTTTVTNFMWSGDNIAYEMDENYAAIKKYLYEPGKIDSQYGMMYFPDMDDYHSNINQFYTNYKGWYSLVKDQVGTVIKVFDTNTGTFTETRHFDTFGNLLQPGSTPSSDWKSSFGFQGKMLDTESGLYYWYQRYYSPEMGRWTTEDPIGHSSKLNLYQFVESNPSNYIDPSGLMTDFNSFATPNPNWPGGPQKMPMWDAFKQTISEMGGGFRSLICGEKVPCEVKKKVLERIWQNLVDTNREIPGLFAPSIFPGVGLGLLTSGATADYMGAITLRQWAFSGFRGATMGATFTGMETGIIAGMSAFANFAFTSLAFEAGVAIGSIIKGILCN